MKAFVEFVEADGLAIARYEKEIAGESDLPDVVKSTIALFRAEYPSRPLLPIDPNGEAPIRITCGLAQGG